MEAAWPSSSCSEATSPATVRRLTPSRAANSSAEVARVDSSALRICAALLHDVEEDTDYTNEDLCNLFGPKVANIVEGLTKISGGIFGDRASLQAETFKKILLTVAPGVKPLRVTCTEAQEEGRRA